MGRMVDRKYVRVIKKVAVVVVGAAAERTRRECHRVNHHLLRGVSPATSEGMAAAASSSPPTTRSTIRACGIGRWRLVDALGPNLHVRRGARSPVRWVRT